MVNYRLFCQHKHFDDCHPITAPLKRAFVTLKKKIEQVIGLFQVIQNNYFCRAANHDSFGGNFQFEEFFTNNVRFK